jgi:glutathione S-transferase
MAERLVLHEYSASGNCYKVRLTAALTGVHLERREYDIMTGETRTSVFLENINANGRIPVLQIGERFIPESNAACYYLADGSNLVPTDRFDRSDMLRWMFFEQYNHEPNIATLRFWMCTLGLENLTDLQRMQMAGKRQSGVAALTLMDDHLQGHEWFVGGAMSLADICLFAYTHVAGDADFDLETYPHILDWIERIKRQPAYLPMDA